MFWQNYIKNFNSYLKLEKSLSINSIDAYMHDIDKLTQYLELIKSDATPLDITFKQLQDFVKWINSLGLNARSQMRIISGVKAFFKYLLIEDLIQVNPAELLEAPKIGRKLPDTLNVIEIDRIISAIDLSSNEGERNKVIIETLYSCGLRVSELVNLKISNLHFKE